MSKFRTVPHPDDALQYWCKPTSFPHLRLDDVHLWRVPLTWDDPHIYAYGRSLSHDEHLRANRFKSNQLRYRFIAGRGILRRLIARYLAIPPTDVQFIYEPQGKPLLNAEIHTNPIHFNVAHSNDRALIAISRGSHLGVDIEFMRTTIDATGLSKRFFTKKEHSTIASLPCEKRVPAFFCFWTCKEAYLKATGEGIAGLQTVEIDIWIDGSGHISILPQEASVSAVIHPSVHWYLYRCWPKHGCVGAIAIGRERAHVDGASKTQENLMEENRFPGLIQTFDYTEGVTS